MPSTLFSVQLDFFSTLHLFLSSITFPPLSKYQILSSVLSSFLSFTRMYFSSLSLPSYFLFFLHFVCFFHISSSPLSLSHSTITPFFLASFLRLFLSRVCIFHHSFLSSLSLPHSYSVYHYKNIVYLINVFIWVCLGFINVNLCWTPILSMWLAWALSRWLCWHHEEKKVEWIRTNRPTKQLMCQLTTTLSVFSWCKLTTSDNLCEYHLYSNFFIVISICLY